MGIQISQPAFGLCFPYSEMNVGAFMCFCLLIHLAGYYWTVSTERISYNFVRNLWLPFDWHDYQHWDRYWIYATSIASPCISHLRRFQSLIPSGRPVVRARNGKAVAVVRVCLCLGMRTGVCSYSLRALPVIPDRPSVLLLMCIQLLTSPKGYLERRLNSALVKPSAPLAKI